MFSRQITRTGTDDDADDDDGDGINDDDDDAHDDTHGSDEGAAAGAAAAARSGGGMSRSSSNDGINDVKARTGFTSSSPASPFARSSSSNNSNSTGNGGGGDGGGGGGGGETPPGSPFWPADASGSGDSSASGGGGGGGGSGGGSNVNVQRARALQTLVDTLQMQRIEAETGAGKAAVQRVVDEAATNNERLEDAWGESLKMENELLAIRNMWMNEFGTDAIFRETRGHCSRGMLSTIKFMLTSGISVTSSHSKATLSLTCRS